MKGLVENNYRSNPAWIKSCENFRSGENNLVQPKYFHTDDNMSIRDWYKAAYPTDKDVLENIEPELKFKDVHLKCLGGKLYIKDNRGRYLNLNFNDSIVRNRVMLEIDVNSGPSFGYIIDDYFRRINMMDSIGKLDQDTYVIHLGPATVNGNYVGESHFIITKDQIKNIHKYVIDDDLKRYVEANFGSFEDLLLCLETECG